MKRFDYPYHHENENIKKTQKQEIHYLENKWVEIRSDYNPDIFLNMIQMKDVHEWWMDSQFVISFRLFSHNQFIQHKNHPLVFICNPFVLGPGTKRCEVLHTPLVCAYDEYHFFYCITSKKRFGLVPIVHNEKEWNPLPISLNQSFSLQVVPFSSSFSRMVKMNKYVVQMTEDEFILGLALLLLAYGLYRYFRK